ncbi:MAG: DUF885 domain-containing protein [Ponticaulis sp.]|nr:DUF885 domain-containing protein [Ponticaulis sp.]|tara:strand:- start:22928 stop:24673 length:1746 start_codon:yes stop_codon:yes gene_type:complete
MRSLLFSVFICGLAGCSSVPTYARENLDEIIADYEALDVDIGDSDSVAEDEVSPDWPDISLEYQAKMLAGLQRIQVRLNDVEGDELSEDDALNLAILRTIVNDRVMLAEFDDMRIPFTGDWGFQANIVFDVSRTRIKTEADAEALIARILGIPDHLDAYEAHMRRGLADGFVSYQDPLDTVIEQIRDQISKAPDESDLFEPFKMLPASLSDARKSELQTEAKAAIELALRGFTETLAFLEEEYAPQTREKPGVVDLPDGKAYYRAVLASHTTRSDLTPEEVHEIGQAEVARIRGEMEDIIEEVEFEGSFSEFLAFLRTDPQFYPTSSNELMARAARLSKDIDLKMPEFFKTLPRLSYGVEPVPASIAPGYTTGRYVGGDPETGRAGIYWVNTYALNQRPYYELPALTAHEAVPGHHHQISLAQELTDVPDYRKSYYATAFGEGWGLYSEYLGREMGLYKTPYERFGQLSYEMWRACRLVADTGMHWYGWSREEGEACFRENSALAELNIKTEVTRYIGWPGQALAYKIGELTIKALREEAEAALGEDFDIREFHDVVLEKGALPLDVLEARVRAWIVEEQG